MGKPNPVACTARTAPSGVARRRNWRARTAAFALSAACAAAPTLTAGLAPSPARAQTAEPGRSEVEIQAVVLSDGARRYTVPVTVGGHEIRAGLDTGSTGLRVLDRAIPATALPAAGESDRYGYGAGTRLDGSVGRLQIGIAGAAGQAPIQVITAIGCLPTIPNCPASHLLFSEFGIQGDGLRGQGFPAILGMNLAEAKVGNPLRALGVRRWIVELPRPGERTGRLILDPTDADLAGFVRIPMAASTRAFRGGLHDGIPACLSDDRSHAEICGVTMFDTGAPGMIVWNAAHDAAAWRSGDPATLSLGAAAAPAAQESFVIGQRSQTTVLSFGERSQPPMTAIFSGLLVYFGFSVLYDDETHEIGLRPRPAAAGLGALVGRLTPRAQP